MRQKIAPIDGGKNDIRLIVVEEGWSEDSGLVDGEPIDPPDQTGGWVLVDFWVEYDEEQKTEDREEAVADGKTKKVKVVTTRKVKPQLHALWVKPKAPVKAKRPGRPKASAPKPEEKKASEPHVAKRRNGRKKNSNAEGHVQVSFELDVSPDYVLACCPHTRQMLANTINVGENRPVSKKDAEIYEPLCADCSNAKTQAAEA